MRAKAEQLRLSKQRDYLDNREKRKATQLAYREKNRQRIRDAGRAYRAANPEKAKAISLNAHHKRRAAKADGMTGAEFFAWRKAAPKVCYWCGKDCKKDFAVDHYVPLSRGGKHQKDNLVIACPPCNATKRAKDPLEFAQSIGRLF
jgi:5-methylcytosine-specific restriction endonuclease McrA